MLAKVGTTLSSVMQNRANETFNLARLALARHCDEHLQTIIYI